MKTLDEVIKALEICWEQRTCSKDCPYMMQEPSCGLGRELDALHYLKEYRKQMTDPDGDHQQLEKARKVLQEFYQNGRGEDDNLERH